MCNLKSLVSLLLLTSCISTTTYDYDFEGSWHSCQDTFKPFAESVELSIGSESVTLFIDEEYIGAHDYTVKDGQLVMGWSVHMGSADVVFYDATPTIDDHLLVRWKPIDYYYNLTAIFER